MVPQPPAHNQHVSGATAGAGALAPGEKLQQLMTSVLNQREAIMRKGIGGGAEERAMWGVVKEWLSRNRYTILRLGAAALPRHIKDHVWLLIPKKNKKQLAEYQHLITNTPA
jgi:hypothetical protein